MCGDIFVIATDFEITPLTGSMGAEVSGLDLSQELSDDVIARLRKALLDYQAIFFRKQQLLPAQQISFARRFGTLEEHDFVKGMRDHPEVIRLVREANEEGLNFGGAWHSDVTHQASPALGSVLYAVDVPPYGGDTLFANQYLAYETLSKGLQEMLDGLVAVHTARGPFGPQGRARSNWKNMEVETSDKALEETEHPVVRVHPETGRKALFVNRTFTVRFRDMTEQESAPLLEYLFQHSHKDHFTCRFRWAPGSVAFWDNRCVMHFAMNDYTGFRREMYRVTISGDRPYGPCST